MLAATSEDDELTRTMLWLKTWHVATGCAAHDTQRALGWSTREYYDDKACVRAVHLAVESMRNSFVLLLWMLPSWLLRNLKLVDDCAEPICQFRCLRLSNCLPILFNLTQLASYAGARLRP